MLKIYSQIQLISKINHKINNKLFAENLKLFFNFREISVTQFPFYNDLYCILLDIISN